MQWSRVTNTPRDQWRVSIIDSSSMTGGEEAK